MHGFYGVEALAVMLNENRKQEIWNDYTATMLHSIGRMLSKTWPFPSYHDLAYPKKSTSDSRSGAEILAALKKRLQSG